MERKGGKYADIQTKFLLHLNVETEVKNHIDNSDTTSFYLESHLSSSNSV